MKRPQNAPSISDIVGRVEPKDLSQLFLQPDVTALPTIKGKYLHWAELRYRKPPEGLNHDLWWLRIKMARAQLRKRIPLKDARGTHSTLSLIHISEPTRPY